MQISEFTDRYEGLLSQSTALKRKDVFSSWPPPPPPPSQVIKDQPLSHWKQIDKSNFDLSICFRRLIAKRSESHSRYEQVVSPSLNPGLGLREEMTGISGSNKERRDTGYPGPSGFQNNWLDEKLSPMFSAQWCMSCSSALRESIFFAIQRLRFDDRYQLQKSGNECM